MNITFHGAARTVTGSKHLVTLDNGKKILLDCGFYQGFGDETDGLNRSFVFNPSEIDYLILSHAHIDHSGNIPNLVKRGFRGPIICTPATKDLCAVMLADTAHILESDLKYMNRARAAQKLPKVKAIYETTDVTHAMTHFVTTPYEMKYNVCDGVNLVFTNSGHILGAAAVNLTITENGKTTRLFFSGDIGRQHDDILRTPSAFPQADYIICESTYGDRLHETSDETENRLLQIVNDTCVVKKGKLIIPAFSLGRTQEVVYALNNLQDAGKLPKIKVYVDSPLSINATNIMRMHPEAFNDEMKASLAQEHDDDPFGFNGLSYINDAEASKRLNDSKEPCIIISASGMADAGRIKHHIKNNIENPNCTILIVGYCSPNSLGGRLTAGNKTVHIFGDEYTVKAKVEVMASYSAHGDYNEMMTYLSCQKKGDVKKVFLVHGEYETQVTWREKLLAFGFANIEIPEKDSVFNV